MKGFGSGRIQNYLMVANHGASVVNGCGQSDGRILKLLRSRFIGLSFFEKYLSCFDTVDGVSAVGMCALGRKNAQATLV
jgi:hypothetical protein